MTERRFGPVRFLPGPNRGKYPHCHSVYVEDAGLLIDPGSDRGRLQRLRAEEGVREVWLSHWHEDHIAHLDLFDDLPLFVSRQDAPMLADVEAFLDGYGMQRPDFRRHWRGLLESEFHFRPRVPAGFLAGGEVLRRGPVTIEVLHTPGHTPGHLAFHFREPDVLFMGDYDLTAFGPWYGDAPCGIDPFRKSALRLAAIPADRYVVSHESPVHNGPITERMDAYLAVIDRREQALRGYLREPRTRAEIMARRLIYGAGRDGPWFDYGEWALLSKHLDAMIARGEAALRDGAYVLA